VVCLAALTCIFITMADAGGLFSLRLFIYLV
jgi:hypothetical protein